MSPPTRSRNNLTVSAEVTKGTPIITVKPNAAAPEETAGPGAVEQFTATISDVAKIRRSWPPSRGRVVASGGHLLRIRTGGPLARRPRRRLARAAAPRFEQHCDLGERPVEGDGDHSDDDQHLPWTVEVLGDEVPLLQQFDVVAYPAALEPRPHRETHSPEAAAARLKDRVTRGALDADSVEAVLAVAGHARNKVRRDDALTPREAEILGLVARGLSNRDIATRLVLSQKTVRNHVERTYAKIGATNRVGASLYALQQGLVAPVDGRPR